MFKTEGHSFSKNGKFTDFGRAMWQKLLPTHTNFSMHRLK